MFIHVLDVTYKDCYTSIQSFSVIYCHFKTDCIKKVLDRFLWDNKKDHSCFAIKMYYVDWNLSFFVFINFINKCVQVCCYFLVLTNIKNNSVYSMIKWYCFSFIDYWIMKWKLLQWNKFFIQIILIFITFIALYVTTT